MGKKVVVTRTSPRSAEMANQQQARKFLTSLMIKHHPDEVVMDEEGENSMDTIEARLLRIAAELALSSAVALIESIDDVEGKLPGSLSTFGLRAMSATRVAATFLTAYGEAYRYYKDAEISHEETLIATARSSLDKVKSGIIRVVGKDKADKHCLDVEAAVDANHPFVVLTPGDIHVPLPTISPRGTPARRNSIADEGSPSRRRNSFSETGAAATVAAGSRSPPKGNSGEAGPAAVESSSLGDGEASLAVPQALAGLLHNEHLAHEILLNPDFKIEDKPVRGAEAAHFAQIKEAMEKMFWERLMLAMTPAEQEGPADFIPGAIVQVRFGGPQGSLFSAKVEQVNEDGTVDVTYVLDGHKETRPISDFRTKSDPLDFEPLLALIEDVREKLTELTPKRTDLAAELKAKLDTELLGQMAWKGVLDAKAISALLAFVVGRLMALQAPVRAEQTHAWFQGVEAQAQTALSMGGGTSPAFVSLLPGIFQTIFERIDETRRDIANAHVDMLRPFLSQHGIAYERQKFSERLRAGEVQLENTFTWLHDVLAAPERASRLGAIAQGDSVAHRLTFAEAVSHLLRLPVRLDTPAAKLPEILAYDGRRLAEVRDELDRLALIAVYSTLLRQFLVNQNIRAGYAAGDMLAALETRLYTILNGDEGVIFQERASREPTFMYAMPMGTTPEGKTKVFFEETSLVARPPMSFDECKKRMELRLKHLGTKVLKVEEEEFCFIPMGGALPVREQRVAAFGGALGLVHPSTGYHICRALAAAGPAAKTIARELGKKNYNPDTAAGAVYDTVWSNNNRMQRDFMVFGGEFLMLQPAANLRGFFDAFFRLPEGQWSGFLAGYPGLPNNEFHETWDRRFVFGVRLWLLAPLELKIGLAQVAIMSGGFPFFKCVTPLADIVPPFPPVEVEEEEVKPVGI